MWNKLRVQISTFISHFPSLNLIFSEDYQNEIEAMKKFALEAQKKKEAKGEKLAEDDLDSWMREENERAYLYLPLSFISNFIYRNATKEATEGHASQTRCTGEKG